MCSYFIITVYVTHLHLPPPGPAARSRSSFLSRRFTLYGFKVC